MPGVGVAQELTRPSFASNPQTTGWSEHVRVVLPEALPLPPTSWKAEAWIVAAPEGVEHTAVQPP
ncbi:hypothetical protein GCM10009634_28150 [Saccharothrix xinjiangensis]